jgi:PAS domain S-box-containing protein
MLLSQLKTGQSREVNNVPDPSQSIPIAGQQMTTFSTPMLKMFDWNELLLRQANISALPGDALVINRPITLFGQYKGVVITAGIAFFALSVLVLVLWTLNRRLERLMVTAKDSEARFRVMMKHAPVAIIVYDPDLRKIIDANLKATQLFGCTMQALLQEDPERFYQTDQEGSIVESMKYHHLHAMSGDEVVFERTIRTCDEKKLQCEIRLAKLPIRGQRLLRASFIDITERKQAEAELRKNVAHFRTLVQAIPDLIWLKDKEGVYLSCNQMFERLFGAKEEDIVGKTDYDFVDRELADFFRAHDRKAIEAGKPSINEEWVNFAVDGQSVLLETIKTPMYDSHGVLVGVLGIGRNITERRRAEEERTKLEVQLQRAHKLEAIGQLAGGVAHDFNNMLGVILGYTDLAMEQIDPARPVFKDLEEIRSAANRSADITRQLLTFARKQTVAPKVIDLNETLESLLKMLKRLIGEDVDLSWLPGSRLWSIKMDPSQIDQILANLCVNARGAISGVGKIVVETGNSIFDEEYCSSHASYVPGEYVRLMVSDNGCGMSKETMSHIFEPFFTTKAAGGGTGLGLATVYGVVKQNKGFINVYSEPGQGTTFTIYLPRYLGEIDQGQTKDAMEPVTGGDETILLVEDEPTILAMTKTMLQRLGYNVLTAASPLDAIRIAESSDSIDLLITDVIMPEMNGRDLAEKILTGKTGLKHLFMSGYTADIISKQGVIDEKVCFIQKPFSKTELAGKVRQALSWKEELEEVGNNHRC